MLACLLVCYSTRLLVCSSARLFICSSACLLACSYAHLLSVRLLVYLYSMGHRKNVLTQNVPGDKTSHGHKVLRTKRPTDIRSQGQNVPWDKISQGQNVKRIKRFKDKTSQGQTSLGTKRPNYQVFNKTFCVIKFARYVR